MAGLGTSGTADLSVLATLFLATWMRTIGVLLPLPLFQVPGLPPTWRGGLAALLGLALVPTAQQATATPPVGLPPFSWSAASDLMVLALVQLAIGLAMGFLLRLAFVAVEVAGVLVDLPLGFGMDALLDPLTGSASPLFGRFYLLLALVSFMVSGGLDALVRTLDESFRWLPPGVSPQLSWVGPFLVRGLDEFFLTGLRLSLPLTVGLFVADVAVGLLARATPQLNLFTVGFPLKEVGGLLLVWITVPLTAAAMGALFQFGGQAWEWVSRLIQGLVPRATPGFAGGTAWGIVASSAIWARPEPLAYRRRQGDGRKLNRKRFNLQLFAEEKSEAPTPRRREESRRRGQVARSPEFAVGTVCIAVAVVVRWLAPWIRQAALALTGPDWQAALDAAGQADSLTTASLPRLAGPLLRSGAMLLWPIPVTALVIASLTYLAQAGGVVTAKGLVPDLNRLNPLTGFARWFSWRSLLELGKSLIKAAIIGYAAYSLIAGHLNELPGLLRSPPGSAVGAVAGWVYALFVHVGLAIFLLGVGDYAFNRVELERQLRMTREEVKEELRQTEGDPMVKSRLRQRQRQLARSRQMTDVKKADVLITNPTHVAVGLRYDPTVMRAPRVLARGAGVFAQRLRQIARQAGVPVIENPPLARSLYRAVRVGQEIPADLYKAVAEVLAYVYQHWPERRPRGPDSPVS
ncbi:MAG: flagellar type III secretion system protein FlhB [Limnochordaceae bacterium]|nr:flagellar type III secretion system protein FlhB [Limnochordaceae bacterium]